MADRQIRQQVAKVLDWHDAHVTFEAAVADLPADLRGVRPDGLPHSPWELLEHIRITQRDILDFSVAPEYREMEWPADYWSATPAPPDASSWDTSIEQVKDDLRALQALARDETVDLLAPVPNGTGQTYLRELLLVADHTAYHVGQIVLVRRLLGVWKDG